MRPDDPKKIIWVKSMKTRKDREHPLSDERNFPPVDSFSRVLLVCGNIFLLGSLYIGTFESETSLVEIFTKLPNPV
jgi:hypothetical protein